MCTNKLEYINYRSFFLEKEKGGVQINRVYELLQILRYTIHNWLAKVNRTSYFLWRSPTNSNWATPAKRLSTGRAQGIVHVDS